MNERKDYKNIFEDFDMQDAEEGQDDFQDSRYLKKGPAPEKSQVPKPVLENDRKDPFLDYQLEENQMEEITVRLPKNVGKYVEEVRKISGIASTDELVRVSLLSYCSYLMTGYFKGQGADFMTSVVEGCIRRENEKIEGTLFKAAVGIESMMRIFAKILKWDERTIREELRKSSEEVRENCGVIFSDGEQTWDF